ncbi:PREDICTED: DNA-directed RNA polymerase III subunit [Prunus dulcis]|uniref:PREDICTED: DNA-directed RNA polymerase III subunit n=1 Tax=Prunus dulcis TaxID=3755 RepID=A0A5E4F8F4_PRUDU|nr:hypothetical protein L3X38_009283 [Prunus dulcis]VVA24374.1 PREDICTED: DNA-directed RNA polymerase III subunit [Prunus dulcis]
MAYRGRGRGGFGGGGGGFGYAIQVPFEDVDLPNVKGIFDPEKKVNKERQNIEVERYSDRLKPKTTIRSGALFVMLELKGFPQELTGGSRAQQPGRKRVRWNPDSGPMRLILCFSVVMFNLVIMMEKKRKKGKVRMKMNKKRRRRQKKTSVMMIIKRTKISMTMMMILIWKMMVMMNLFCSETVLHTRLLKTSTNLPHFSSTKWSIQLLFVFL